MVSATVPCTLRPIHLVDAVLALILIVGGVIGAQFNAQRIEKMRGERLRLMLGLLVFAVGLRFAYELVVRRTELFRSVWWKASDASRALAIATRSAFSQPASATFTVKRRVSSVGIVVAVTSNFTGEDLVLFGTVRA